MAVCTRSLEKVIPPDLDRMTGMLASAVYDVDQVMWWMKEIGHDVPADREKSYIDAAAACKVASKAVFEAIQVMKLVDKN